MSERRSVEDDRSRTPNSELAKAKRQLVILSLLSLAPVILTAVLYPLFPDTIAFSSDSDNAPGEWRSKAFLFLPCTLLATMLLFCTFLWWRGEKARGIGEESPYIPGTSSHMPFWIWTVLYLALDAVDIVFLACNLTDLDSSATEHVLSLIGSAILAAAIIFVLVCVVRLIQGKRMRFTNIPEESTLEKRNGGNKQQLRAAGTILLAYLIVLAALLAYSHYA